MNSRRRIPLAALVLAVCALLACGRGEDRTAVTVATTPDIGGMGIAAMLADSFATESKTVTRLIITEERFIPDLVRSGVADVVLTTSPSLRRELEQGKLVRLAQTVAYNDFLLVGPKRDPAGAGKAKTAPEALGRIARRDRAFCSPVDVPDLRHREALLWEASTVPAADDRRYRPCPGNAQEVLQEASRRNGYTLTDRATFEAAGRKVDLEPLLQGTPLLHNDLMVVLARPKRRHANAEWFVQWLMSHRGRDAVDRYRYHGGRRFFMRER